VLQGKYPQVPTEAVPMIGSPCSSRAERCGQASPSTTTSDHQLLSGSETLALCSQVSKWLLGFLVQGIKALPDHLHVEPVPCTPNVLMQRLEVEADDMSSFVQKKANKQWIWMAMDATTRQVMAFYIGDRSRRSAKRLWAKIPQVYRQHATFYTDQYGVYEGVIPAAQHKAISKLARKTNHIERFNNRGYLDLNLLCF
jgi:IS1 family transposase